MALKFAAVTPDVVPSVGEFELIRRYFAAAACARAGGEMLLGIGDDCALFALPPGEQLAVSTDSMVAGVHFPDPCDPYLLGQRVLAAAVSDLAAMGATPIGFTLSLTLPRAEAGWLEAFVAGLERMAAACAIRLAGGDTTRGPLCIGITVLGRLPAGSALTRAGAQPGERLCVGGPLGDAAGALELLLGRMSAEAAVAAPLLARYWSPLPQLALGQALRGRAGAALDISDGLVADCSHIAEASAVSLVIEGDSIPLSEPLVRLLGTAGARHCALAGGDDYLLAFTLAKDRLAALLAEGWPVHVIGRVEAGSGVRVEDAAGRPIPLAEAGYNHFAQDD